MNIFSYLEKYMLITVNGAFNIGGGTENDAIFHTNTYSFGDDLTMINLNSPNFGHYLAADEPRVMQFAIKYQF